MRRRISPLRVPEGRFGRNDKIALVMSSPFDFAQGELRRDIWLMRGKDFTSRRSGLASQDSPGLLVAASFLFAIA